MATGGRQGGRNGQSMNHSSFQGSFDSSRLRALSGSQQYSSSILNQLLQQQSAARRAEASLHQQNLLSSLLLCQADNSNLAAAVQQELVASLGHGSSSLQQMLPHHMNRSASQGLAGGLLSRGDQQAMLRRLPVTSPGQSLLPSLSARQQQQLELIRNSERGDLECQKEVCSVVSASAAGQETATQLPCQARGMATDHNSSTAYFEVPTNATHGMHLLCSYPACRSSGVKFRYCLFCKKPVTKQNFRSRHLHAELDTAGVESTICSIVDVEGSGMVTPAAAKRMIPKKRPASLETAEAPSAVVVHASFKAQPQRILDEDEEEAPILSAPTARPMVPKVMMDPAPTTKLPSVDDALRKIMRRRRWNSLLSERPAGFQNMEAWMSEVIAVSDTSKVFAPSASNLSDGRVGAKTSVDLLARWGALLAERPVSSADCAVTAWLTKVLSISCPSAASKKTEETAALTSQGLAGAVSPSVRGSEDGVLDMTNVAAFSEVHRSAKRLKPSCL